MTDAAARCSRSLVLRLAVLGAVLGSGQETPSQAGGHGPDARLPDHDCVRGDPDRQLLPWARWLADLGAGEGSILGISANWLVKLSSDEVRERAAAECRVGLLMADVLHTLVCYLKEGPAGCYPASEKRVRDGMAELGLDVLIGTSWPVLLALNSEEFWSAHVENIEWEGGRLSLPVGVLSAKVEGLDCADIASPLLDWRRFRGLFGEADWYQQAVNVAYGPELEKGWRDAFSQCPMGFTVANLVKAMLCAHTESVCYRAHATMIMSVLADTPLHLVAGSGWPIFWFLNHVASVTRRHRFRLDFRPRELLSVAGDPREEENASQSMRDVVAALPALREAALGSSEGSEGLRMVYVTMAHGPRFSPYVSRFVERARAVGIGEALVVFCLDAEARAACEAAGGICVRGTPSILNKFTLPLVLLRQGLDVMWVDLDVFVFQDPTAFVAEKQRQADYELLVSGSFAVDCVCSGVVFFRAAPRTVAWLEHLLVWMYDHTYEHDQKAFNALLRAGERVAFDGELPLRPEETPRWGYLDPETEFVSARHVDVAGWTGDADRIVLFHMLHGDSDDAQASRQFAARNNMGSGYVPLLDLFFNRTDLPELYSTPVLPHRASPELREALWRSRWPTPRPTGDALGRCNETVPMRF